MFVSAQVQKTVTYAEQVYGRQLTSLVVSREGSENKLDESIEASSTKFGEDEEYSAKLVSVSC